MASQVPSGAIATAFTEPSWPVRVARGVPSAAQVRAVPSSPAVASQVPSGAIATANTEPSWPVRVARGVPSAAQVRTVPSSPAVASQVPSGAIATARTEPRWPVRTRISASEGRSGGGQDGQAVQARRPDRSAGSWRASSGIPPSLLVKVVITAAGGSAGPSR